MSPVIGYVSERFFLVEEGRHALSRLGELRAIRERADLAGCHVLGAFHGHYLDEADLEAAPDAVLIVNTGTAILCDLDAATRLGIVVVHFPGVNARSVAEHTMALLLDLAKGVTRSDRDVRAGVAWAPGDRSLMRFELRDRVLGLVGFGNVGAEVAAMARSGFGMRVRAWARREPDGVEWEPDLDRLLAGTDIVSLHLALNEETRGIVGARRVALLQPHALVVNTARAALVDVPALAEALSAGRVAGAAFDVWPGDRSDPAFALLSTPNTVLTQHNAGLTREAARRSMDAVATCVEAYLRSGDEPPPGRLANPPVWPRRRRLRAG